MSLHLAVHQSRPPHHRPVYSLMDRGLVVVPWAILEVERFVVFCATRRVPRVGYHQDPSIHPGEVVSVRLVQGHGPPSSSPVTFETILPIVPLSLAVASTLPFKLFVHNDMVLW